MSCYVQIGTNNGNDEFRDLCRIEKPDKIVLVEPNNMLLKKIQRNYQGIDNVNIEIAAIVGEYRDEVSLYIRKHMNKIGSLRGQRYDEGYSMYPLDDWGDNLDEIRAPGLTFMELCGKYNINHIDYLQIDAEGSDGGIIMSIDFNMVSIDKIQYEWCGYSMHHLTRHTEPNIGLNGMLAAEHKLSALGYDVKRYMPDVIAIKNENTRTD